MTLSEMKEQQTQLIVQRAQLKDTIEGIERQLMALGFAIGAMESEQARATGRNSGDAESTSEEMVQE